jgi:DNA modification methylase
MAVIDQAVTKDYALYNADCMEVLPELPTGSVDVSIYSPPFPELYQYSDDVRDVTNCTNYEESVEQLAFVAKEVSRLTKPGRLSCVHCTDLRRGSLYQRDFPADLVRIHEEYGMHFFCRVTIWKDPWEFARRTRMKSLMHKQVSITDSANSRIAPADYLLIFKKAGDNKTPIRHEQGFQNYIGGNQIPEALIRDFANYKGDPRNNLLSHWIWRQYASPVWMDIRRKRLLPYQEARENVEEKHVCPLQLDVIERCLVLWSNPGETLLTPFMGVGSEAYCAAINNRHAIGIELKPTYYRQAVRNVRKAFDEDFKLENQRSIYEVGPTCDDECDDDLDEDETMMF